MCGIAGIFAYRPDARAVEPKELERMTEYMLRRGPDGGGYYICPNKKFGLGHRRLSIIDLNSRADQPMSNDRQSLHIVFNGEIYNHLELRKDLEKRGYIFRTTSDTEVILHLYNEFGPKMASMLRGMFALGIVDEKNDTLYLARDKLGIKPLYYSDDGQTVRFSSQVKALIAGGSVNTDPDFGGWASFYMWGFVQEPLTTFKAIRSVDAGSFIVIKRGERQIRAISFSNDIAELNDGKADDTERSGTELLGTALLDSIKAHLVSDVPIGCFLSAGIDSGTLLSLMIDAGARDITAITLGFTEFENSDLDEVPGAVRVANHYAVNHEIRRVSKREFDESLDEVIYSMDQPSIDGINTWFVSRAASEIGLKVAISGLGGDELFNGYPSFTRLPLWLKIAGPFGHVPAVGKHLRILTQKFAPKLLSPKASSFLEYAQTLPGAYFLSRSLFLPWELPSIMGPEAASIALETLQSFERQQLMNLQSTDPIINQIGYLESSVYMRNQLLRDSDWAGMHHSLEIRVPLADDILINSVRGIKGGVSKKMFASSPSRPIPLDLISRPKTGFLTPTTQWMNPSVITDKSIATNLSVKGKGRQWALQLSKRWLGSIEAQL